MSYLQRFLPEVVTNDTLCELGDCIEEFQQTGTCSDICLYQCPSFCKVAIAASDLSPPPVIHQEDNLKRILIISGSSIITTVFLLMLLVLCIKIYYKRRSRTLITSRRWSLEEARNWEFDGPSPILIDHPIWHIRTIGLNPTVISSIKVCKYSKKDGIVEGTDCTVCLSEFEEEETLRLLPKCKHAFHLSCIDTWLRSHTNCPLCRAPIVLIIDDLNDDLVEIRVENEVFERDLEEEEREGVVSNVTRDFDGEGDESRQRVGRSVSLGSLSGIRVSSEVDDGRGKEKGKGGNIGSSIVGRSSFLKRSISYNGK